MIAAIMQPYFFPYMGYFQLMKAVDLFVLYDDAQYMKGGWINRNRILAHGNPSWLTLPVRRESVTLPINRRHFQSVEDGSCSIKNRLRSSYLRAPYFPNVFPFLCELLDSQAPDVAQFNAHLLKGVAAWLGISCKFLDSSTLDIASDSRGQARVLAICHRVGATRYVNAMGGSTLYSSSAFNAAGLDLYFLKSNTPDYAQFSQPHVPSLSIVDVMMFNSQQQCRELTTEYELVSASADDQS